MKIKKHTQREFADALKGYLPPGQAWKWPEDGFGDQLLMGAALEFARAEDSVQLVLDNAIERHRPQASSWHIDEYRRVATAAMGATSEAMPRRTAAIGGHIGDRLWSHEAPGETFQIDLLHLDMVGPARIGSRIGDRLWGHRSRAVLLVRYYRSVVDPKPIWDALMAFKQAHIYLWFIDISGTGGEVNYGQN